MRYGRRLAVLVGLFCLNLTLTAMVQASVTLLYFRATAQPEARRILIEWETATEPDNLLFLVQRAENENGPWQQVHQIPARGDVVTGAYYRFEDNTVLPGHTYWYRLDDMDGYGRLTSHPPVMVSLPGATPPTPTPTFTPLLPTLTPTPSPTVRISPTATATPSPTATPTPTPSPTATPLPTPTPTPVTSDPTPSTATPSLLSTPTSASTLPPPADRPRDTPTVPPTVAPVPTAKPGAGATAPTVVESTPAAGVEAPMPSPRPPTAMPAPTLAADVTATVSLPITVTSERGTSIPSPNAFGVRLPPTTAASSHRNGSEAGLFVRIGLAALAVAGALIAIGGWFYRRTLRRDGP